ncbi:cytochrome P450 [Lentinula raphanica]|nr:cytochrome P450 [Lentinula raphanica]
MGEVLAITCLILVSVFSYIVLWFVRKQRVKHNLPLPPGPRKLPLLGNSLNMPSAFQWLTFSRWAKQFNSDVLHLEVAGGDYIILNSYEAITDLLDKRSGIYSSRPHVTMLQDLWDRDFLLMPYGEDLKAHRKLLQQEFHPTNTALHQPHEKRELVAFLNNLIEKPDEWLKHLRLGVLFSVSSYCLSSDQHAHRCMTGATILAVAYGFHVQDLDDPNIVAVEEALAVLNSAAIPGAFIVYTFIMLIPFFLSKDVFPILKYVPYWFPGASFKRKAREWNGTLSAAVTPPFIQVKQAMVAGNAQDSFSSRCLKNAKNTDPRPDHLSSEEEIIKETAGTMYEGGSDTGVNVLRTFILAMTCFPHVQREAQEELDRVVGKDRLPDYDDLSKELLPYLCAVIYETFRWQPVAPLAFPHRLDADDAYKGYHIPKGSTVIPNVCQKRWLLEISDEQGKGWKINPDMRDPATVAFGFGRRVCPGKHMGLSSFRIIAASLLHSFNISPPLNKFGEPVVPKIEYISGLVHYPVPFKCSIKPRSEGHVTLMQQSLWNLEIGDC